MKKTLVVIGLISLLALFSVSAWPFSSKNTQESALVPLSTTLLSTQEKTSTEKEENKSETQSTPSTTTSNSGMSAEEIDAEAERIKTEAMASLEAGLAKMDAGHEVVSDAAVAYEGELARVKKVAFFGKVNGAWNGGIDFSIGVSGGMVVTSRYIFELGVMKKNLLDLSSYGDISAYGVTFSIGYIF